VRHWRGVLAATIAAVASAAMAAALFAIYGGV